MAWKEVSDKPYMLEFEYKDSISYAMVLEFQQGEQWVEIYRGCIFSGNSNDAPVIVTHKNNRNCNFKSFHEVCRRIEKILDVRRENPPPEPNILEFLEGG